MSSAVRRHSSATKASPVPAVSTATVPANRGGRLPLSGRSTSMRAWSRRVGLGRRRLLTHSFREPHAHGLVACRQVWGRTHQGPRGLHVHGSHEFRMRGRGWLRVRCCCCLTSATGAGAETVRGRLLQSCVVAATTVAVRKDIGKCECQIRLMPQPFRLCTHVHCSAQQLSRPQRKCRKAASGGSVF